MDFKTLILFLFLFTFISRAEFIIHPSNEGKITSGVRVILYTHLFVYCSVTVLTILSVDLSSSIQGGLICVALTEEMQFKWNSYLLYLRCSSNKPPRILSYWLIARLFTLCQTSCFKWTDLFWESIISQLCARRIDLISREIATKESLQIKLWVLFIIVCKGHSWLHDMNIFLNDRSVGKARTRTGWARNSVRKSAEHTA